MKSGEPGSQGRWRNRKRERKRRENERVGDREMEGKGGAGVRDRSGERGVERHQKSGVGWGQ